MPKPKMRSERFVPRTRNFTPLPFRQVLFFADFGRGCIWVMRKGADGNPNPATISIFASGNYLAGTIWPPVVQHFIETSGWRATSVSISSAVPMPSSPLK